MDADMLKKVGIGIIMGLFIGYFILWGQTYSELNTQYQQLNHDYIKLNQSYNFLQQNYTILKQECGQALIKYEQCVGRENFFEWINRLTTLGGLAKFLGLI